MTSEVLDILIVGSGLTGLNLGRSLLEQNRNLKILLIEKSKSCGGRMATRRIGDSKFDHGAQFIKSSEISGSLIQFWNTNEILSRFPSSNFEAYCGRGGITSLAKKIAESLKISYNCKAIRIEKNSNLWKVLLEEGEPLLAKDIVLTCPLPQSLEILERSGIPFDLRLLEIKYSMAIVLIVQWNSTLGSEFKYLENFDEEIFSISSQREKGLSSANDYTVVMQADWSESHFEKSEEELLLLCKRMLERKFFSQKILELQVKKWRFCQPTQIWDRTFESPIPGIMLAGDAFGGASLLGALKSSKSVAQHLLK